MAPESCRSLADEPAGVTAGCDFSVSDFATVPLWTAAASQHSITVCHTRKMHKSWVSQIQCSSSSQYRCSNRTSFGSIPATSRH